MKGRIAGERAGSPMWVGELAQMIIARPQLQMVTTSGCYGTH